jgi:hypothetical protein
VWARDARRVRDHTTNTTTSGLHLLSCSASLQCNFTLLARSLARFSSYIIMDSDFAMESVGAEKRREKVVVLRELQRAIIYNE